MQGQVRPQDRAHAGRPAGIALLIQLSIIEFVHGEGIIHRDLKLENLCMGVDSSFFQLYLIDFGLSKKYIDPANNKHIPLKSGKSLLGSIEYASLNNHTGKGTLKLRTELSRRDDIESIAYLLMHLYLGSLPWSHLTNDEKGNENEAKILAMKKEYLDSPVADKVPGS